MPKNNNAQKKNNPPKKTTQTNKLAKPSSVSINSIEMVFSAIEKADLNYLSSLLNSEPVNTKKINLNQVINGTSALHRAVETGNVQIINFLLQKKADPNLKNSQNKTAFQVAIEAKEINVIGAFLSHESVNLKFEQAKQLLIDQNSLSNPKFASKIIKKSCKNGQQFANLLASFQNSENAFNQLISVLFKDDDLAFSLSFIAETIQNINKNNIALFMQIFEKKFNEINGNWLLLQSKLPENKKEIINPYILIKVEENIIIQPESAQTSSIGGGLQYRKLKNKYLVTRASAKNAGKNLEEEIQPFLSKGLPEATFDYAGYLYSNKKINQASHYLKMTIDNKWVTEELRIKALKNLCVMLTEQENYIDVMTYYELLGPYKPKAYSLMAQIYEKGFLGRIDPENAFLYYKKAAENGELEGQYRLAKIYSPNEKGGNYSAYKDTEQFLYWLAKAVERKHINAMYNMACFYSDENSLKKDYAYAIELFEEIAAAAFDQEKYSEFSEAIIASYEGLGIIYMNGWGCEPNLLRAIYFLKKAADLGNIKSMYVLGYLYTRYFEPNSIQYKNGLDWYEKASAQDHIEATLRLIDQYLMVLKEEDHHETIKSHFNRLKNHPISGETLLYFLCLKYNYIKNYKFSKKENIEKNLTKMINILNQIVKDGAKNNKDKYYTFAQSELSTILFDSSSKYLDYQQAFHYLEKAADSGCMQSQYKLGVYYYEGFKEDSFCFNIKTERAKHYLTLAANQGFYKAINYLRLISKNKHESLNKNYRPPFFSNKNKAHFVIDAKDKTLESKASCTWFNKEFSSKNIQLRKITSSHYKHSYIFIDFKTLFKQSPKLAQTIPPAIYQKVSENENSSKIFKFNGTNIKKLDHQNKFSLNICLPDGTEKEVQATHEWKIDKVNRVLLYAIPGDDNRGCLYLGAKFVKGGLHTTAAIEAEEAAGRGKAVAINWPKPDHVALDLANKLSDLRLVK